MENCWRAARIKRSHPEHTTTTQDIWCSSIKHETFGFIGSVVYAHRRKEGETRSDTEIETLLTRINRRPLHKSSGILLSRSLRRKFMIYVVVAAMKNLLTFYLRRVLTASWNRNIYGSTKIKCARDAKNYSNWEQFALHRIFPEPLSSSRKKVPHMRLILSISWCSVKKFQLCFIFNV